MSLSQFILDMLAQNVPLFLQVGGGALTGYYTNQLALRMLFRRFGPYLGFLGPFGGVIVETRDDFTHSISELVEDDVINVDTLHDELQSDALRAQVHRVIERLVNHSIYQDTRDLRISDIPGVDVALDRAMGLLETEGPALAADLVRVLLHTIKLEEWVSPAQRERLAGELVDRAITLLGEPGTRSGADSSDMDTDNVSDLHSHDNGDADLTMVARLMTGVAAENAKRPLTTMVPRSLLERLAENVTEATADLHLWLRDFEPDLDRLIDHLYSELELRDLLVQIEQSVKERSFAELLGQTGSENILNEVFNRVAAFARTDEGDQFLQNVVGGFLEVARSIDAPLTALLTDELRERLEAFLQDHLPDVTERLVEWLRAQRTDLEELLEEAIKLTLESQASEGVRAWLKQLFYGAVFHGDLARRFDLVGTLVNAVESRADPQTMKTASAALTSRLLQFFEDRAVGEIVEILEEKGLIDGPRLAHWLKKGIETIATDVNLSSVDTIFSAQIGDVIEFNLAAFIESRLKPVVVTWMKRHLFSPWLTDRVHTQVRSVPGRFEMQTIGDILESFGAKRTLAALSDVVLRQFAEQRSTVVRSLTRALRGLVTGKTLADVVDERAGEQLSRLLIANAAEKMRAKANEWKDITLDRALDALPDRARWIERGTDAAMVVALQAMQQASHGQIAHVVRTNLADLSDDDIEHLAEDFMGRHLGPITTLGGVAGAIIGALLYVLQSHGVDLGAAGQGTLGTLVGFGSTALVYGFAGWITNVFALWAIFKPYQPHYLLGYQLPLTPGIVARNKPAFARSMGRFIDQDLLSPQSVHDLFNRNPEALKGAVTDLLSENDYAVVDNLLRDNFEVLSRWSFGLLNGFVQLQQDALAHEASQAITGLDMAQFDLSGLERRAVVQLVRLPRYWEEPLSVTAEQGLQNDAPLRATLPASLQSATERYAEDLLRRELANLVRLLSDEGHAGDVLRGFSGEFDRLVVHSTDELLSDRMQKRISRFAARWLLRRARSESSRARIMDLFEQNLAREFAPDRRLGDVFEGAPARLAAENTRTLVDALLGWATDSLVNQRDALKDLVAREMDERAGVVGQLLRFRDTTDAVVDRLVDTVIPAYIRLHEPELHEVVDGFVQNLLDQPLRDVGVHVNRSGVDAVVGSFLQNPRVVSYLQQFLECAIGSAFNVPLEKLLELGGIRQLDDVLATFDAEFGLLVRHLATRLETRQDLVLARSTLLLHQVVDRVLTSIPTSTLGQGFKLQDVRQVVHTLIALVTRSPSFREMAAQVTAALVDQVQSGGLGSFVDHRVLEQDIALTLDHLMSDDAFRVTLNHDLDRALRLVIDNARGVLPTEMRDYLLELLVSSLYDASRKHIVDLVNSIDVAGVTELQVNAMTPRKIESLFNSFASVYFHKLRLYGWWGAGIGVIVELLRRLILG